MRYRDFAQRRAGPETLGCFIAGSCLLILRPSGLAVTTANACEDVKLVRVLQYLDLPNRRMAFMWSCDQGAVTVTNDFESQSRDRKLIAAICIGNGE